MGRITVFTSGDLNSKQVVSALQKRDIPFTEVSVAEHPSVRQTLKALAFDYAIPQVFFNTRHVGGATKTLAELSKWDNDTRYKTPREKYEAQIASAGDPSNILAASPNPDMPKVTLEPTEPRPAPLCVELPDGTMTTVGDIMQKLRNTLARGEVTYKKVIYKNCISGSAATSTFVKSMQVSESEALAFGQRLIDAKILHHVGGSKQFKNTDTSTYRLQCFMSPDVLNSFRIFDEASATDPFAISLRLDGLLTNIEDESLDDTGKVNLTKAASHEKYVAFEEAVCELQVVDIAPFNDAQKLAFGINMYKILVRYGLIKVGVPTSESDRLHFQSNLKFNLGGLFYTFQEWVDGILRGNRKATYHNKVPFSSIDRRRRLAVSKLDYRVHFALALDSRIGSTSAVAFVAYTPENIHQQLDIAARVYCADDLHVLIKSNEEVLISNIFNWYRSDFSKKDIVLLGIIGSYLEHVKKSKMERSLQTLKSIKFRPVDWAQNATSYTKYVKKSLNADVKGIEKILRRFMPPKATDNEEIRLATLHSLNILDTLPEERFDRITRKCKEEFDVPLVFVSLVDMNRQWFKSKQWACPVPEASETGRDVSFCGHAILNGDNEILVVENALEDDRFADNPLVTGELGIRFYAGCNLTVPSAGSDEPVNIGSLCIIDRKPRKISEEDLAKLRKYAGQVKREILRRDSASSYMSGSSA